MSAAKMYGGRGRALMEVPLFAAAICADALGRSARIDFASNASNRLLSFVLLPGVSNAATALSAAMTGVVVT